ncbi:MAG: UTP--glucose-1-phosphate uridylyltransferase [Solirubrobacteraceae bacterium]
MEATSSITAAVIPVAGLGTRLLPATRSQPKEMLPVLDKPVVQYVVEELAAAGVSRVLFVTGRRKRAIEDHFDHDPELGGAVPGSGLEFMYTRQPRPLGLGDALARGASFAAGGPVVVALGDSIIEEDQPGAVIQRLVQAFGPAGPSACGGAPVCAAIAVAEVPDARVSSYGIVVPASALVERVRATIEPYPAPAPAFEASDLVEKPDPGAVESRFAVMGRYVLSAAVLSELAGTPADASGEVQLADAIRARIAAGERVVAVPLLADEHRHDIGTPAGYAKVFLRYALHDPRFGGELRALAAELLDGDGAGG